MTEIVRAPGRAIDALGQLSLLSDDELDTLIKRAEAAVPVVDAVARFARVERGRRAVVYERKVTPGMTFSGAEKNRRSEEMMVARWYDASDVQDFVEANGWRKCVTEARRDGFSNGKTPISKRQLATGVSHPAVFSDPVLEEINILLPIRGTVLDPFAGTGRIHELATEARQTIGVEIEPEWALLDERTIEGNALDLTGTTPIQLESIDAIATSPTYGNRLADSHRAADPDARRSYTHDLGRPLHPDNSGALQWGPVYRLFHRDAYREAIKVLKPGGRFVLNISDHIRDGRPQGVPLWHVGVLMQLGLEWIVCLPVTTDRLRQGAHSELRADVEYVVALEKPV